MSPGKGPRIVFDGQSLNLTPFDGLSDYPRVAMSSLPYMYWNEAYGGKSWTVLLNGDSQVASLANRYAKHNGTGQPVIAVLNGGQYDLLHNRENQTGAQAYADLLTYCTALRANGVSKIIVCTMSPIHPAFNGGTDPAARVAEYNSLVLAGNALYDAVADVAAIPELSDPFDAAMYPDGVHWSAAGAVLAANVVRPVIEEVAT